MEFLKHGKVKKWKFCCPECGCEFLAELKDRRYTARVITELRFVCNCPDCGEELLWSMGELYEEAFPKNTVLSSGMVFLPDPENESNGEKQDGRERLTEILSKYFDIGDSYYYRLTRVKTAFAVGTMELDDFVEFDDETVDGIAEFLLKNGVTFEEA